MLGVHGGDCLFKSMERIDKVPTAAMNIKVSALPSPFWFSDSGRIMKQG